MRKRLAISVDCLARLGHGIATRALSEEARTLSARSVLDVERGETIENGVAVVKGERIVAVGAAGRRAPLVMGHGMKLVCLGSAFGLVMALISTRTLGALLYRVGAFDLTTFAGVTIAFALVALLASYIPALRATRADPMIALGHTDET